MKIVKGHLNRVEQMIENDEYCVDIIHQSKAIQSSLREMDRILLEHHLSCCVVDQMKNDQHEKSVEEIMKLFNYS